MLVGMVALTTFTSCENEEDEEKTAFPPEYNEFFNNPNYFPIERYLGTEWVFTHKFYGRFDITNKWEACENWKLKFDSERNESDNISIIFEGTRYELLIHNGLCHFLGQYEFYPVSSDMIIINRWDGMIYYKLQRIK